MPYRLATKKRTAASASSVDRVARFREARRLVAVPDLTAEAYRRRRSLEARPAAWLRHYWPDMYAKPFAPAHLAIIAEAQEAVRTGGMYAVAYGRGRGKTATLRGVALWAIISGLCRFPILVGKTDKQAGELIDGILRMMTSERFAAAYPELATPFTATHCDPHRMRFIADARTGERFGAMARQGFIKLPATHIGIDGRRLPSPASNAVIASRGITSHDLRGTHYVLEGGQILRPDLALVDDPETSESAKSHLQTEERLSIIHQDIRGMAGVGKKLPILCGCTISRRACLADRITDPERSPEWRANKFPMLVSMPSNEELWQQYNQLRLQGIADKDGKAATSFYRANRRSMDAGAAVQWRHDIAPGAVSAIQTAMDLYLSDRIGFASEYQQDPIDTLSRLYVLSPDAVARQVNEYGRGQVPATAVYTTAGIDVNADALTWAVVAVRGDLCGWILDYGIYPGGQAKLWTPEARYTIQDAVFRGLGELVQIIAGRWKETMHRISIDGNYETETVYAAIAHHGPELKPDLIAARGVGSKNYYLPSAKSGVVKIGESCHILKSSRKGAPRKSLWYDSHQWHKRLQCGFLLPPSAAGAVSAFAGGEHRTLGDHVCADVLTQITIREDGREVMAWSKPDDNIRNDLADAVKMALVGAAVEGVVQHETKPKPQAARPAIIRIPGRR